jgi:hypothetical protein
MTMVALPRFAAKALTSSEAGSERAEARSGKTMVADEPVEGAGIGVGVGGIAGGAPAAAGRLGGAAGKAGCWPASAAATDGAGGVAGGIVAGPVTEGPVAAGRAVEGVLAGGGTCVGEGSSGAACTALRGAAAGGVAGAGDGAVTAGIDALATDIPGEPASANGFTVGGGGGGAVPTPNSDGEAVGEEGSANGADWAACWALVRSATSEAVSFFKASASGASGFAGTVAMLGYG